MDKHIIHNKLTSHFPFPALMAQSLAMHSAGSEGVLFVGCPIPAVTLRSLYSQCIPV